MNMKLYIPDSQQDFFLENLKNFSEQEERFHQDKKKYEKKIPRSMEREFYN